MLRDIVVIDEELCDGCGECVPACEEAALQIIDGKARVVADKLCDGMGACLGHCPKGAIRIEKREAEDFDEAEVARRKEMMESKQDKKEPVAAMGGNGGCPSSRMKIFDQGSASQKAASPSPGGGCPGSRMANFSPGKEGNGRRPANPPSPKSPEGSSLPSALGHWPVQLRLLPAEAPMLKGASLLIAADCVPVAYDGFHSRMLSGRSVAIACPKLDDPQGYVEKLARMIEANDLQDITVAHMEVPCCTGILQMVLKARDMAGSNITINDIVVSTRGEIVSTQQR
jgi:NAD-dependent dihydropyrimidine dehydrogenase PreA subunit